MSESNTQSSAVLSEFHTVAEIENLVAPVHKFSRS